MTTNQTIEGMSLLPCPFCAKPAKLDVEDVRGDHAWCFIRCSYRCKVAPYVGESACIWYWSEGKKHRHRIDEAAKEQAMERAITAWNTRNVPAEQPAPVAVVLPARIDCPVGGRDAGWNACLDKIKRLNGGES